ncbi:septal ring lytic transglycosylase RlpA family protein [Thermodesulfobacteriota bacterium]
MYKIVVTCGLLLCLSYGCQRAVSPTPPPVGHPKPYKVLGKWYQPIPHATDFHQRGDASWYGKKFHGKKTSSGEVYNMHAMTAAHKTLPLQTYVRVHNMNNDRKIDVRINDRGPFVRGRIIDLSYAAAKQLGVVGPGTAPVEIMALGMADTSLRQPQAKRSYRPVDYYKGNFTIQVGAFKIKRNAERLKQNLDKAYQNAHITEYQSENGTFYRVRVGHSTTLEQAVEYEADLIQKGYTEAMVIAE